MAKAIPGLVSSSSAVLDSSKPVPGLRSGSSAVSATKAKATPGVRAPSAEEIAGVSPIATAGTYAPTLTNSEIEVLVGKAKAGTLTAEEKALMASITVTVEGKEVNFLEAVEEDVANQAEFESTHTKVGPVGKEDWVRNEDLALLSEGSQAELKARGVDGYNAWVDGLLNPFRDESGSVNLVDALEGKTDAPAVSPTQMKDFGFTEADITKAGDVLRVTTVLKEHNLLGEDNQISLMPALQWVSADDLKVVLGISAEDVDKAAAYKAAEDRLRAAGALTGEGESAQILVSQAFDAGLLSDAQLLGVSQEDISKVWTYKKAREVLVNAGYTKGGPNDSVDVIKFIARWSSEDDPGIVAMRNAGYSAKDILRNYGIEDDAWGSGGKSPEGSYPLSDADTFLATHKYMGVSGDGSSVWMSWDDYYKFVRLSPEDQASVISGYGLNTSQDAWYNSGSSSYSVVGAPTFKASDGTAVDIDAYVAGTKFIRPVPHRSDVKKYDYLGAQAAGLSDAAVSVVTGRPISEVPLGRQAQIASGKLDSLVGTGLVEKDLYGDYSVNLNSIAARYTSDILSSYGATTSYPTASDFVSMGFDPKTVYDTYDNALKAYMWSQSTQGQAYINFVKMVDAQGEYHAPDRRANALFMGIAHATPFIGTYLSSKERGWKSGWTIASAVGDVALVAPIVSGSIKGLGGAGTIFRGIAESKPIVYTMRGISGAGRELGLVQAGQTYLPTVIGGLSTVSRESGLTQAAETYAPIVSSAIGKIGDVSTTVRSAPELFRTNIYTPMRAELVQDFTDFGRWMGQTGEGARNFLGELGVVASEAPAWAGRELGFVQAADTYVPILRSVPGSVGKAGTGIARELGFIQLGDTYVPIAQGVGRNIYDFGHGVYEVGSAVPPALAQLTKQGLGRAATELGFRQAADTYVPIARDVGIWLRQTPEHISDLYKSASSLYGLGKANLRVYGSQVAEGLGLTQLKDTYWPGIAEIPGHLRQGGLSLARELGLIQAVDTYSPMVTAAYRQGLLLPSRLKGLGVGAARELGLTQAWDTYSPMLQGLRQYGKNWVSSLGKGGAEFENVPWTGADWKELGSSLWGTKGQWAPYAGILGAKAMRDIEVEPITGFHYLDVPLTPIMKLGQFEIDTAKKIWSLPESWVSGRRSLWGDVKTGADLAATFLLPFYGTHKYWNQMSPGWKVGSLALDVAMVLPFVGKLAEVGGAALRVGSTGARIGALGGREGLKGALALAEENLVTVQNEITTKKMLISRAEGMLDDIVRGSEVMDPAEWKDAMTDVENLTKWLDSARSDLKVSISEHSARVATAREEVTAIKDLIAAEAAGGFRTRLGQVGYGGLQELSLASYGLTQPAAWFGGAVIAEDTWRRWNQLTPIERLLGVGVPLMAFGVPQAVLSKVYGYGRGGLEMHFSPGRIAARTIEEPPSARFGQAGMAKTPTYGMVETPRGIEDWRMLNLWERDRLLKEIYSGISRPKGVEFAGAPERLGGLVGPGKYSPEAIAQSAIPGITFSATPMGEAWKGPVGIVQKVGAEPFLFTSPYALAPFSEVSAHGLTGTAAYKPGWKDVWHVAFGEKTSPAYLMEFGGPIQDYPGWVYRGEDLTPEIYRSRTFGLSSQGRLQGLHTGPKEYAPWLEEEFVNPLYSFLGASRREGPSMWTRSSLTGRKVEVIPVYSMTAGARRGGVTPTELASLKGLAGKAELRYFAKMASPWRGQASERTIVGEFIGDRLAGLRRVVGEESYIGSLRTRLGESIGKRESLLSQFGGRVDDFFSVSGRERARLLSEIDDIDRQLGAGVDDQTRSYLQAKRLVLEGEVARVEEGFKALDNIEGEISALQAAIARGRARSQFLNKQAYWMGTRQAVPTVVSSRLGEGRRASGLSSISTRPIRPVEDVSRRGVEEPSRPVVGTRPYVSDVRYDFYRPPLVGEEDRSREEGEVGRYELGLREDAYRSRYEEDSRPYSRDLRGDYREGRYDRTERGIRREGPRDRRYIGRDDRGRRDIRRVREEEPPREHAFKIPWEWESQTPKEVGRYILSAEVSPRNKGVVNIEYGVFSEGETTTLYVKPEPGVRFVKWKGDIEKSLSTKNPVSFSMHGDRHLVAVMAGRPVEKFREMPELYVHLPDPFSLEGKKYRVQKKWVTK